LALSGAGAAPDQRLSAAAAGARQILRPVLTIRLGDSGS